jgi:hypothetical protein
VKVKKQITVKCEHLAKRLLAMAGTEESPDASLFASVIALALIDLAYSENSSDMHTARHYIFGGQMQKHCELVGINYDFIIDRTSLIFRR